MAGRPIVHMSEAYLAFSAFVEEVEEFLASDVHRRNEFRRILLRFRKCPKFPRAVFNALKDLIKDNEELGASMTKAAAQFPLPETLEDDFGYFMTEVGKLAKDEKLGMVVGETITYYTEGFVPIEFIHHYLDKLLTNLDEDTQCLIHWAADEMALRIKVSRVQQLPDNERDLFHSLPLGLDLRPILEVPKPLQFLSMINLIVPASTSVISLLKCLKLYSSGMITIEEASEWIGKFDELLQQHFVEMIMQHDPSCLSIGNLKATIDRQIKSKMLQVWAFGPVILEQLTVQSTQVVESNIDRSSIPIQLNEGRIGLVPASILELQARAFYEALKGTGKSLREFEPVFISNDVVGALYGRNRLPVNDPVAKGIVLNRAARVGGKVMDSLLRYYERVMSDYESDSVEWRTNYGFLLKNDFARQILVFHGLSLTIPDDSLLDLTLEIAEAFLGHFKTIDATKVREIKSLFDGTYRYMSEHAALFVFYFVTVMHMIKASLKELDNETLLRQIPELVFSDPSPLAQLGHHFAANIDMPLLEMAKMLKRTKTEFLFTEDVVAVLLSSGDDFIYEAGAENGELHITAAINPTVSVQKKTESQSEQSESQTQSEHTVDEGPTTQEDEDQPESDHEADET